MKSTQSNRGQSSFSQRISGKFIEFNDKNDCSQKSFIPGSLQLKGNVLTMLCLSLCIIAFVKFAEFSQFINIAKLEFFCLYIVCSVL